MNAITLDAMAFDNFEIAGNGLLESENGGAVGFLASSQIDRGHWWL